MIRAKALNKEVYVADERIVKVGREDIEFLKGRVGDNERKRIRLCAHRDVDEKLHEMFIVLPRGTYIRPHKHMDKAESLHVIEGSADVVFFDGEGNITDVIPIGDYSSGRRFYCRVTEPAYHTLLIRSDVLVFHETTQGPFFRSDTGFAPWAAEEGDERAVKEFMEWLVRAAAQFVAQGGNTVERG